MNTTRRTFLKKSGATALTLSLLPLLSKSHYFLPDANAENFVRKSPESQGISSAAISQFLNAANGSGLQWHSFVLLRHGHVIAEAWWKPFDKPYKHTLYSLSKSFTSTAVGILVKEGKITVEDQVISFFPDELPEVISDNLKQMKIKHLLTMNTGHAEDTTPKMRADSVSWIKTFLSFPVAHAPGSHFLYNSGATYMLGAIIHKITGQDLETFLTPRLFKPLGILNHDWEKSPDGLNVAGWGLRVTTEDIARLGQLYLQKGKWNGKEILTEAWVNEASSAQTTSNPGDSDWSQGYGYQFWRCKPGFYRGDGAFGQYCVVMPQHDAVLVVNSESWDMQKQMTIMWETLLPAMQTAPLKENEKDFKKLKSEISNLSIPVTKGAIRTSPLTKKYANATIKFEENEFGVTDIQLNLSSVGSTISVNSIHGKQSIQSGWEKWITNKESIIYPFAVPNLYHVPSKIASSASWINENTLQLEMKFVEGIHGDKITCVFNNNHVLISFINSVAEHTKNNSDKRAKLEGTIIS